jgi:transposase
MRWAIVRFELLPGQRFDTVGVKPLIDGLEFGALLADKAFDSNEIIADLDRRGAKVAISQHPRRFRPIAIDTEIYKWRHLIENFFGKLKEFKCIAMRADKPIKALKLLFISLPQSSIYDESQQALVRAYDERDKGIRTRQDSNL